MNSNPKKLNNIDKNSNILSPPNIFYIINLLINLLSFKPSDMFLAVSI